MRRSCLVVGAVVLWTLGAAFSAPAVEASKKIVRVAQEGSGVESERDGSSWERALGEKEFAKRLKEAAAETEFWVAKGRYRPSLSGDTQASFELGEGVAVYGGFKGDENTRDERDPNVNVTVLTGDLDDDDVKNTSGITLSWRDIRGSNSSVVVKSEKCTQKTVLDGVTVTGGNGAKDGGGMYNLSGSPKISRCSFVGNQTQGNGGGMANRESSPVVENCAFERNRADKGGGGMFNFGKIGKSKDFVPVVEGCVFSENSSELHGGGMSSLAASPRVAGTSFVGNLASSDTG